MAKALESGADAVILDLEDSVPIAGEGGSARAGGEGDRRRRRAVCRLTAGGHGAHQRRRDRPARRRSRGGGAPGPGCDLPAQGGDRRGNDEHGVPARPAGGREGPACGNRATSSPCSRARSACCAASSSIKRLAARRRHLYRQRARRRSADRSRLRLVDRRHRTALRALQGPARHAAPPASVLPLDGVFSDLNDEAGLIQDSRAVRAAGLHRAHGDPPQADRAGAAGLRRAEAEAAYYRQAW